MKSGSQSTSMDIKRTKFSHPKQYSNIYKDKLYHRLIFLFVQSSKKEF